MTPQDWLIFNEIFQWAFIMLGILSAFRAHDRINRRDFGHPDYDRKPSNKRSNND